MKLKGTEIFLKVLEEEKVDIIFGYPGGAVLDLYDQLYESNLRHILVRHEQGAVHAADGYARATGKVGVCLVTSGPGATNTVTGIATANMDSIPLVVFTGQVPTGLIGNDAFQECDITGITRPCTKHNFLVRNIEELASTIKEAFHIARSGRPGPVLVDLPKNVMAAQYDYDPANIKIRNHEAVYKPAPKKMANVFDMLNAAKKPLIMTGGGVILGKASEELTLLARKYEIPVTGTLMGLGSFPGTDPLWLGMLGMHGTYYANMAVSHCDFMLAVGVRFDDRVTGSIETFAANAKIVQIDIDPSSINKNVTVDLPIIGDTRATLKDILRFLEEHHYTQDAGLRAQWLREIAEWREKVPLNYCKNGEVIKPQYVIEKLQELTKGDALITTDVGQHQMWTAQFFHFDRPNTFVSSGGLGTMGFGLPAAIGVKCAFPDKQVVAIAGDGSIQMNIQELATAAQYNIAVKVVLLNNEFLGMPRQWQEMFYNKRYSHTDMTYAPDFVKLAEAFGVIGLRATKPAEVETVLKQGLAADKPVLMDFRISRDECVYPMVHPGGSINQMTLGSREMIN
ncbi:MAG TPA: biosynthetic-type acetolactate synthase large subunit [Smithellaceae bacterium]|jgi:acetolactate synthase I/II/III large subunit|nr:biosynthetic-type acetolactate synthase large subunit [Smithellaceae bacterium]HOG81611.1 biosynthetic-type acetolactate synthase large subunit [Smithellaceae bacterium]HOQ41709.1 biosynthetic-type acetolactate synthase large subunit [Smithellaceae bacterium]HPL66198.1 biosynthetic-type acetolactate synthase large subunit [Smithellaceae bacterium]HQP23901.1 biosynthetic-type acetolactate synthase large subunit [Smithellaceae bacterium]